MAGGTMAPKRIEVPGTNQANLLRIASQPGQQSCFDQLEVRGSDLPNSKGRTAAQQRPNIVTFAHAVKYEVTWYCMRGFLYIFNWICGSHREICGHRVTEAQETLNA